MLISLCQFPLLLINSMPNHQVCTSGQLILLLLGGWAGQRYTLPKHLAIVGDKNTAPNYVKLVQSGLRGAERVLAVLVNLHTSYHPTGERTVSQTVVMYGVGFSKDKKWLPFHIYLFSLLNHTEISLRVKPRVVWSVRNQGNIFSLDHGKIETYYRRKWGNERYFKKCGKLRW